MKKNLYILMFILLTTGSALKASVKIDTSIVFKGTSHNLSICIPSKYDTTISYPLVVGIHFCGGNSKSYRDGLSPIADSLNMVIACPDNFSNQIVDADLGLIVDAINKTRSMYKIDTTQIFLTGMSCNGEMTLRQGLRKFYPFKGIMPWVPWMSSIDNKQIDLNSNMPITLSTGTLDDNYQVTLNLYDSLKTHNAKVNFIIVPGINHTMSFPTFGIEMLRGIRYLNDTGSIKLGGVDDVIFAPSDSIIPQEVEILLQNKTGHNLLFYSMSSKSKILSNPVITVQEDSSKVKLKLIPTGKSFGSALVIFEARDKNGLAIEQTTFKVNVQKLVGIKSLDNAKIVVFPNPANEKITINAPAKMQYISIFNAVGNLVYSKQSASKSEIISVSHFNKGIYFVEISGEEFIEKKKLIIN
jgi:hypothetical protein